MVQQLPGQPVLPVGEPPPETSSSSTSLLRSPGSLLSPALTVQHFFSLISSIVVASPHFSQCSTGSETEVTNYDIMTS